jgi:N-acyl-D-amino-acid deacylase
MTLSILIRNGTIYDGSGAAGFLADVGIQDGRIAAIGSLSDAEAETVIEAQGLAVAPGFIDMHSHGDYVLPFLPTADSKVHQGITLEVVGNCGSSMAPINADMGSQIIFDQDMLTDAVIDWSSFGEFLARLRRSGISVNVASLVGHGTIREKVMGMTDAPPSAQQLAAMQDEVRRAMQEGAVGLSTGLIYPPSIYGDVDEIAALAEVVAEHGGIYTSHIRGEGNTLIEAILEALEVGRRAQVRVQISHLKASGVRNWHKMPQALELLDQARRAGIDVMADMYTYPASNTSLSSLVPAWAHVGGRDAMIARLQDQAVRARIHYELADAVDANGVDWDQIYISSCTARQDYEGRHLKEIASERQQHPWDAVLDVLIETRLNADIIEFTMKEENVALGLQDPHVMICTDATGRAAQGPFSAGKPHPRNYGSFPRLLGMYVRQQGLFPLEEAVRKMTSLPAGRLGLSDRGRLSPNYWADVVIFDAATVADEATFTDPHRYPTGIEWVLVNGEVVIREGQHTGAKPGMIV